MTNVVLPKKTWVNLYAATSITVGTQINSLNLTPNDVRLASTVAEPVITDDHLPLLFGRGTGQNDAGDPGAWAFCLSGGAIDVVES